MTGCGCQERANRLAVLLRRAGLRRLARSFELHPTRTLLDVGGLALAAGLVGYQLMARP